MCTASIVCLTLLQPKYCATLFRTPYGVKRIQRYKCECELEASLGCCGARDGKVMEAVRCYSHSQSLLPLTKRAWRVENKYNLHICEAITHPGTYTYVAAVQHQAPDSSGSI